jgi:hypothetical protein
MQKLILLSTLFIFAVLPSMSQVASATVFSENGEKFWVVLNGIKQNANAQTNVKVTGLTEPAYKFKIIFEDETIPSLDENVMTQDVDGKPNDVTYVIKKNNKGKYIMRVNSFQPAKGSTEPAPNQVSVPARTQEPAKENTGGTTTTITQQTTTTGTTGTGDGGNMKVNMSDGMGGNVNFNMSVSGIDGGTTGTNTNTTTTTTTKTTSSSSSTNSSYSEPAPGNNNNSTKCIRAMSSGDFANAKKSVEGQSFEENKLQVAKQVLKGNCVSSAQVKDMLSLFSFEKTKVDYAKFAYDRTTDPNNYYTINDAFSFSSSVTELNEYIDSK